MPVGKRSDNVVSFEVTVRTILLCKNNLVSCSTLHVFAIDQST